MENLFLEISKDLYHPAYLVAAIASLAVLAWALSYLVPSYRRELKAEDRTRLTPLDGLRGVVSFVVVFLHGMITFEYVDGHRWGPPPSAFYTSGARASVGLFFCVTAFLFWPRVIAGARAMEPGPFLRARAYRILPLYLFSCLLALGVASLRQSWVAGSAVPGLIRMGLLGARPWSNVGVVDMLAVDAGVTWTLQYEWAFYFALPAMVPVLALVGPRRLGMLAIGAVVLVPPAPYLAFLPGILAVYAARNPALRARLCGRVASLVVIATVALLPSLWGQDWDIVPLAMIATIFVPIACGNTLFGVLTSRGLRLMGVVSYSVYLLHGIVLYCAHPWLLRAKHAPWHPIPAYWACLLGCAAVALILSMTTYKLIELPFIRAESAVGGCRPPRGR